MPEIARFLGILIRMYPESGGPHHRPHFHAYYQDSAAVYAVDHVQLIAGSLPRRQRRLVEAWAVIRLDELQVNWELIQSGRRANRIEPLS
ncbi:MAG: DUF4160 domain-containing protein [Dehalococcoidia bacterium]|nr:DUF4160 domain-containing protein [Dehalococcoidia bacterium]